MVLFSVPPVYSGKAHVRSTVLIFSANKSILLRKMIMAVSTNHLLLQISLNNLSDSSIRLVVPSSYNVRLYSESATQKMHAVTSWKLCDNDKTTIVRNKSAHNTDTALLTNASTFFVQNVDRQHRTYETTRRVLKEWKRNKHKQTNKQKR